MIRNEKLGLLDEFTGERPRPMTPASRPRTIVIRQGSTWLPLALLCLCVLLAAVVLLGQRALREIEARSQRTTGAIAGVERRLQELEAGMGFDSRRRRLLLGMRDHILRANPRVSLHDAYRYAQLALDASEKYPAVDPLLLLSIGIVESGYDPQATSRADARGLYQIWPSTGRLLVRALGWEYDDATLYDPMKNTEAAALYLDILFAAYRDPQMVLAEYNGGPLNAGYFRAGVVQLAAETKNYVPRVLELHRRLREEFAAATEPASPRTDADPQREGKTLAGGRAALDAPPARTAAETPPGPARPGR
jgi:hypothetical protein